MLKRLSIATSALALSSAMVLAQTGATTAPGSSTDTRRPTEVQALQNAKVSLAQAIDMAERQANGKAIKIEFEAKAGAAGQYEVKVLTQDGKILKYKLDANSGQVVGTENERFESYFTRLKPADLQNAKTSLTQAIAIAEQKAGGKAMDAEVEREGSEVRYEIKVVNGDRRQEVKIDANGQVVVKD